MRITVKKLVALGTVLCLTVSSSIISFAGEWNQDDIGQWYVNDDGSFTKDNWQLIDNKWYYFDSDGYLKASRMLHLDGKDYYLLDSGALETNKDYGFASSDENGVFTLKTFNHWEQDENTYAEYCKQFGIDMNEVLNGLGKNTEYSFSCPTINFPKDSEGNPQIIGVVRCIIAAIDFNVGYWGVHYNPCTYTYKNDKETGMFNMSFKLQNTDSYSTSIIMY